MTHQSDPRETRRLHGYEPRDASIRGLLFFTLGFFVFLGAALGILYAVRALADSDGALPPATPQAKIPGPPLQTAPVRDLALYMEDQRRLLYEPRWIDREAGKIAIPIDRAMQLLVEEQHREERR